MIFAAATNNAHKLEEMRRILIRMGHTLLSQQQMGVQADPEETGTTFEENAVLKAQTLVRLCNMPVLADDSGLCVDALGGAPGVYSARYCGRHGDDAQNNRLLLERLREADWQQRRACFVSVICAALPTGDYRVWRGECPGTIAFACSGDQGFGYDPLFIPQKIAAQPGVLTENTEKRTYAQLCAWEKDAISHRAAALAQMEQGLAELLALVCKESGGMLTGKQRAVLRRQAQQLDVVFQVGKGEIDEQLVQGTRECLAARELIKMRVLESSAYTARQAAQLLAEKTGAECVQVIGSKFVLYLPKKEDSRYAALLK